MAGLVLLLVGVPAFFIIRFIITFIKIRRKFHNLPGPPHSFLFGHLHIMARYEMESPSRIHPHVYPPQIREEYNLPPIFYLDLWPFNACMLVVMDPDAADQFTVDYSLPKYADMKKFIQPLAGSKNLLTMENPEWKYWRSIFNPGFSASHLMSLAPSMVDSLVVFREILGEIADSGRMCRLEEIATRLTFDIIGNVSLDHDLNSQRSQNELIAALRDQQALLPAVDQVLNPLVYLQGLIRPYYYRKNTIRMDNYIGKILDERYASFDPAKPKQKSVIDLALQKYFQIQKENGKPTSTEIDATFKQYAIDQIKIFIFAGHDTTSSTISYAYHLLAANPEKLAKLRAEHDAVFGKDTSKTAQIIRDKPHLLNEIPYTLAVVKESLRLYSPASTTRAGEPGFFVHDPKTGIKYPTEGVMTWSLHTGVHLSQDLWGGNVHDFEPERFMPQNAASIPKHSFRPFELGPRNCIGQELAMIEARLALVLVVRDFVFKVSYEKKDLAELKNDGTVWTSGNRLQYEGKDWRGDKTYPVLIASAKPNEGMPSRVHRRRNM